MSQVVRRNHRPQKVFINLYGTLNRPQAVFLMWLTEKQFDSRHGNLIEPDDGVIMLSSFETEPQSQKILFQAGIVIHRPVEVGPGWTYNQESDGKAETRIVPIVGPWFENSGLDNTTLYYEIYKKNSNFRNGLTLPGGYNWEASEEQKRAKQIFSALLKRRDALWNF